MIRSLAWRYLDLISGDERVLCWCKVLPGILAVFYWTYQKIWVKKNGKIIYISSKIWRTFGYLMASLGQSAVVDAFDAARPIQDKSSCHRARDFTKVCCSGHESDSWANGQLFFFTLYSFKEKSSLQLFFPCLPLPGFCLPTACLSVLLRSTATEHQRRHFRWVELHTLASWFQVELTEKSGVDAVIFFHTFRLVPVPGGSSWGWSWSRWAHAGREFGSCQSLIAQDSCRCESMLFKGHRSFDELPAHPVSKATYVSNLLPIQPTSSYETGTGSTWIYWDGGEGNGKPWETCISRMALRMSWQSLRMHDCRKWEWDGLAKKWCIQAKVRTTETWGREKGSYIYVYT